MLLLRDTERWLSWISVKYTLSLLCWPRQHTVFRSTAACFIIDSSQIHASLKSIHFLKQLWIDEMDWKFEKIWYQSFITTACFNHYKYVLTARSFIFQYGHWETHLKTPRWGGKWQIPTTEANSGGAQDPKLIHRMTGHVRLTNLPDSIGFLFFSSFFSHPPPPIAGAQK